MVIFLCIDWHHRFDDDDDDNDNDGCGMGLATRLIIAKRKEEEEGTEYSSWCLGRKY